MKLETILIGLLLGLSLLLAGCAERLAPAPDLPAPTPPVAPAAALAGPDLARGQQLYLDKQCAACHSPQAQGGIGPRLAGTPLEFEQFLRVVRTALPPKPAFNEVELTGQDAYNIYGWLRQLQPAGAAAAVPAPALQPGELLGMAVWTEGKCDSCHGAFAQGSAAAPALVELGYPYEMERAKMRRTAETIPAHAPENMDDGLFQRLYRWLQAGANPAGGC
jgi:mono/diheme cytochrome c family protein